MPEKSILAIFDANADSKSIIGDKSNFNNSPPIPETN